jgi:hypothetical protein
MYGAAPVACVRAPLPVSVAAVAAPGDCASVMPPDKSVAMIASLPANECVLLMLWLLIPDDGRCLGLLL